MEDAGMFYQWNRKTGWSISDPVTDSDGGVDRDYSSPPDNTREKANDGDSRWSYGPRAQGYPVRCVKE